MKKRFFVKRFLIYLVVILVPTILLGALYYAYVNYSVRQRIAENTAHSLTSVYNNVEHLLGSAAYQQQLLTSSPRLTLSLTKMMNQDNISYEDSVIMSCVNAILTSPVNNNLYINSIYFYIAGGKKFLSTDDGLISLDEHEDPAWYKTYMTTDKNIKLWMEKRVLEANGYRSKTEVVSIYQRITNAIGVIVVNISPDRFNLLLNQVQTEPNQALLIVDFNGNVLFSNQVGYALREQYAAATIDGVFGNTDMVPVSIDGRRHILSSRVSEKYRIRVISLIPEGDLYRQPNQFLVFFLALVAASALVAVWLSFAITRKNFKQIDHLLEIFSDAENGSHPALDAREGLFKDEYDIVLGNIVNLYIHTSQLKLELAEKHILQKDAEMAALQMQMNPHFLFNTLQTLDIEVMRKVGQLSSVNHIIQNLSDILKYSLGDPAQPVMLREEILFLKRYADIQQYRYGDKFILYYDYSEEDLNVSVMRLMLQPLVENSLYHGIKPLVGNGCIKLKIQRHEANIKIVVIDNGVGMDKTTLQMLRQKISGASSTNIGLTNLHRRLILHYGEENGLQIRSKKGVGTAISFTLKELPISDMIQE